MIKMNVETAIITVEEILENTDLKYNLSDTQELTFRGCWQGKSYQEIADKSGYNYEYIKHTGARLWRSLSQALNQKVTKSNIHRVLKQYWQEQTELNIPKSLVVELSSQKANPTQKWGEVIDVVTFFGITTKSTRYIAGTFKQVICRSLRNAPPFLELLAELILFISPQQDVNLFNSIDDRLNCLVQYLSASCCLLILDDVEAILTDGGGTKSYRQGYEGYGQLFRRLADEPHQSCLVLNY